MHRGECKARRDFQASLRIQEGYFLLEGHRAEIYEALWSLSTVYSGQKRLELLVRQRTSISFVVTIAGNARYFCNCGSIYADGRVYSLYNGVIRHIFTLLVPESSL